jgi:hypothetical protein
LPHEQCRYGIARRRLSDNESMAQAITRDPKTMQGARQFAELWQWKLEEAGFLVLGIVVAKNCEKLIRTIK